MRGEASDLADVFSSAVWALVRNYVICEGTVRDRDEVAVTVDVALDDTDAVFFGVPLKVLTDDVAPADLELPTIGAEVLLGFRDGNLQRPQVLVIHQADIRKLKYQLVEFNGGTLGGLPISSHVSDRINLLENAVNALIQLYNTHTHPVAGATAGPTTMQDTDHLTPTKPADIANPKITQ